MYDVIVVGAGPAGLSVAQVLGRARRRTLLLSGGEARNAGATEVHGVIAHDGKAPVELIEQARKELARYPTVEIRDARASGADGSIGEFFVELGGGEPVHARRLVLAAGVVDVLPEIHGLAPRWGRDVLHCPYCHGWEVRDEPLAVLALSIVDAYVAAHLTQWSADVVFCCNDVAIAEDHLVVLNAGGVQIQRGAVVSLTDGPTGHVRVVIEGGGILDRRAVFVHPPTRQRSDLARRLGCRMLDDDSVAVDELGQTTTPGVYAVGDMARRPGREPGLTFVACAMGDGQITGLAVNRELFFTSLAFG
jgi:thioredoxin reductase